jgi:exodeoxyribonuclease V alpha subunit
VRSPAPSGGLLTTAEEQVGVGDRVATRRNDTEVGIANRELWTVVGSQHGALEVVGDAGRRTLPVHYAVEHVDLAYATTAYGAQGSTVSTSHVLVGEHTSRIPSADPGCCTGGCRAT